MVTATGIKPRKEQKTRGKGKPAEKKSGASLFAVFYLPQMLVPIFFLFLFQMAQKSRLATAASNLQPGTLEISRVTAKPAGLFLQPFLKPRTPGSPGSAQVQRFLLQHFATLGYHAAIDRFESQVPPMSKNVTFTNLIFTLNPSAGSRVIIAAHYDSKVSVPGQGTRQFIGATDSAVPCAMMAELAFALTPRLRKSPMFEDITLQFVFFDGEEAQVHWSHNDSLYGARHLASKWKQEKQIENIDLFLLLDLLGAPNPTFFPLIRYTQNEYERLRQAEIKIKSTLKVASGTGKPYFFATCPPNVRYVNIEDDHSPFMAMGVPIIHMIPYPFPKVWHTMADDESALDNNVIEDLTRILYTYLEDYFLLTTSEVAEPSAEL